MNNFIEYLKNLESDDDFFNYAYLILSIITINNNLKKNWKKEDNNFNILLEIIIARIQKINNNQRYKKIINSIHLLIETYQYIGTDERKKCISNDLKISKEFYKKHISKYVSIKKEILLSSQQQELFNKIIEKRNCCFSTTTSFGKSFLIRIVSVIRNFEKKEQ